MITDRQADDGSALFGSVQSATSGRCRKMLRKPKHERPMCRKRQARKQGSPASWCAAPDRENNLRKTRLTADRAVLAAIAILRARERHAGSRARTAPAKCRLGKSIDWATRPQSSKIRLAAPANNDANVHARLQHRRNPRPPAIRPRFRKERRPDGPFAADAQRRQKSERSTTATTFAQRTKGR